MRPVSLSTPVAVHGLGALCVLAELLDSACEIGSNRAMAERLVRTVCPRDCYDACGVLVAVREDGAIRHVRGDPDHGISRGKLCRKCTIGYNGVFLDPDARLTRPLRRAAAKGSGRFEPVSWDAALRGDRHPTFGDRGRGSGRDRARPLHRDLLDSRPQLPDAVLHPARRHGGRPRLGLQQGWSSRARLRVRVVGDRVRSAHGR